MRKSAFGNAVFFLGVGELPETENKSCEDISLRLRKFRLGDAQVGFCPEGRIPLSRLAPWLSLGCWTAEIAVAPDTLANIPRQLVDVNSTEVLRPTMSDRRVRARFSYFASRREDCDLRKEGDEIEERRVEGAAGRSNCRPHSIRRPDLATSA